MVGYSLLVAVPLLPAAAAHARVSELASLLAAARPVTAADAPLLQQYAAAYGGPPRFWLSPSYLAYDGANQLVVYAGCLLVLRRKQLYGRPVLYLLLPPMCGRPTDEAAVLAACVRMGIGAKLSPYDMARLHVLGAAPERGNTEYIYAGGYQPRQGRAGRRERNSLNVAARAGQVLQVQGLPGPWLAACVALAKQWHGHTGRHRAEQRVVRAFAAGQGTATLYTDSSGQLRGYSLTEQLAPGQHAIVARIHDHTWGGHPDLALYLHQVDCGTYPASAQLNMGAPVGSRGLAAYKQRMRPTTLLQLHTLPGARQLTLADVA